VSAKTAVNTSTGEAEKAPEVPRSPAGTWIAMEEKEFFENVHRRKGKLKRANLSRRIRSTRDSRAC